MSDLAATRFSFAETKESRVADLFPLASNEAAAGGLRELCLLRLMMYLRPLIRYCSLCLFVPNSIP